MRAVRAAIVAVACIIAGTVSAYAQGHVVQGTVLSQTENDAPTPLIGATVSIKNSTVGATTDINGHYSITVTSADDIIVCEFIGYKTEEAKVGSRTVIDFTLKDESQKISEVVVTALGITRQEKSLGYAVSKLSNEEFTAAETGNWLSGLNGKVAGLNMDTSSAGPAGSMRVTLRGEGSLSHDKNAALFVVDGVPINSDMDANTSGSSYGDNDAPIDYGNGAGDLNPDDIESISVLKGPSATALYGSRAANGAIIITTKSGRKGKGLGIQYSTNVVLENPGFWPDFQYDYGAGNWGYSGISRDETGLYPSEYSFWTVTANKSETDKKVSRYHSRFSFGEKVEGQLRYMYESRDWENDTYTRLPYKVEDNYKDFYQMGATWTNALSVDAGDGKGQSLRVSVKDVRNRWIVPNTGYNTQSIGLSMVSKKNRYIQAQAKVNYYRKTSDNLPISGYNDASPLKTLMWLPVSVTDGGVYDEYVKDRTNAYWERNEGTLINNQSDNPYWMCYEHLNTQQRDRIYGNVSVTANLIRNELTLTLRTGLDLNNDFRTQQKPFYSRSYVQGMYREQTARKLEINNDFLLAYKKDFTNGISLNASFGGNNMIYRYSNINLKANMLDAKNVYMLSNVKGQLATTSIRSYKSINSFYGFVSFGYRDMFYIDITGRNDWSSTLAKGNNSYFYPSVSASVLLSEIFKLQRNTSWISLLKLRGSWANVGNDTDPYQIIDTYTNSADFSSAYALTASLKNPNLRPENVESWEVGLEAKLFKGIWSFDVAYYDSSTTDQIISVPTDWITGASSTMINAGEVRNYGVELSTNIRPINTKNLKFNISLNWSKNWNYLVSLAEGVDVWQLNKNTIGSRVLIYAYPGQRLGQIYGTGFLRAPEGAFYYNEAGERVDCSNQVIVDKNTGNPILDENLTYVGNMYPKWRAGANLNLRWKSIAFSMAFTASYGGRAYSMTNAIFSYMGKNKNSLEGRYDGLIHEGVNANADGTFSKNTTVTTNVVDYWSSCIWHRNNVESNTFDTSFLKLKEMRLEYSLPKRVVARTKALQGMSVALFMTNVFCITSWPQYDPEVASMAGGSLQGGVETGSYPMTRTYGLNVKLKF
ncbi:MAG: SusC/RagA family TonB-linked outer membrane protein [Alistipes sp.]|nr:SusC/RagA family TonB-linked outer membrane protein [Alistipes sp.]